MKRTRLFITTLFAFTLATLAADEPLSLVGTWEAVGELPGGDASESTITISTGPEGFEATVSSDDNEDRKIDRVKAEGKEVTLELDVERDGQSGIIRVIATQTEVGKLSGKWYLIDSEGEDRGNAPWEAVRISEPEPAVPTVSIAGKWESIAYTDNGRELPAVVEIVESEGKLSGTTTSERGETKFDLVKQMGREAEMEMVLKFGDNEVDVRIEAALQTDDHLDGKWIIFDQTGQEAASGKWEAKRVKEVVLDIAGTWDVVATSDDGDHTHQAIFEKTEDGYKGEATSDLGSMAFTTVTVEGDALALAIPFGEGTITIAAKKVADHKLEGTWHYHDSDGNEQASDAWEATRKGAPASATPVGEWALHVALGEMKRDYGLRVEASEDGFKGTLVHPEHGDLPCDSVAFKDGALSMVVTREIQGNAVEILYDGQLSEDGKWSGKVSPKGYEDQFSGTFNAERK